MFALEQELKWWQPSLLSRDFCLEVEGSGCLLACYTRPILLEGIADLSPSTLFASHMILVEDKDSR